jgi:hypothetical protein
MVAGLLAALAGAVGAEEPNWPLPQYAYRAVCEAPSAVVGHFLVRVPLDRNAPVGPSVQALDAAGGAAATRLVHTDSQVATVLVQFDSNRQSGPITLYYGLKAGQAAAAAPVATAAPFPVRAEIQALAGKGVPNDWEKLRFLRASAGSPARVEWIEAFDEIDPPEPRPSGRRRQPRSGLWGAAMQSFVLCPAEGVYRMALDCRDSGFVFVDGELRVAWPGEHPAGVWQRGAPFLLKAGPHLVEVCLSSMGEAAHVRLGWVPPGREAPVAFGPQDLLAGAEADGVRVERVDRSLHPAATVRVQPAYRFRESAAVFVPVAFANATRNWVASEMRCKWSFGDGATADGPAVAHVYAAPRLYRATLEVRDDLGFVGSVTREVDCRKGEPAEYAVAADLAGLPAVCYARTKVRPALRLRGSAPLALDVEWDLVGTSGASRPGRAAVTLAGLEQRVLLGDPFAGELTALRWRVAHAGVEILGGTVDFLRPPFPRLPARVSADRLLEADGRQMVLVPNEQPNGWSQPPIPASRALGRLLCVDDSLAAASRLDASPGPGFDRILARLVDRPGHPGVRLLTLPAWEETPGAYGPLLKFVEVSAALQSPPDVIVLSVGLRDLLEMRDVELFEQHAAALSDLVSATRGVPVVWVTPPPFPPDPDLVRPYAAAIRKVAAARGIPVADLFTAFQCAADGTHALFRPGQIGLSDVGHRLAGSQIARALLGDKERPR